MDKIKSVFKNKSPLFWITLIGIVVRLLLMPFFAHEDLLLTYKRSYDMSFGDRSFLTTNQHIPHLVQNVNLYIYDIVLPREDLLPITNSVEENEFTRRNLFIFKIPYLIFDIGVLILLKRILDGNKYRNLGLGFYFLNPILLFGVYMFGRYETIPLFFMVLGLYLLKNSKQLASTLSLSLALITRPSIIMLIPIHIVLIGRSVREKIKLMIYLVTPFLLLLVLGIIYSDNSSQLEWLSSGHHTGFFFNFRFDMGFNEYIYVFWVVYALLAFLALQFWFKSLGIVDLESLIESLRDVRKKSKLTEISYVEFAYFYALTFIAYYMFSNFHPQYLIWSLPFITIALVHTKTDLWISIAYFIIILVFPLLLLTWGPLIYMNMFSPISESLGSYDLFTKLEGIASPSVMASIARSIVFTMHGIIAYRILSQVPSRGNDNLLKKF